MKCSSITNIFKKHQAYILLYLTGSCSHTLWSLKGNISRIYIYSGNVTVSLVLHPHLYTLWELQSDILISMYFRLVPINIRLFCIRNQEFISGE